MPKSILFILMMSFSFQVDAQPGNSVVDFFSNIFNIRNLIESEDKSRLKRHLKYYAQNTDELITLKKEIAELMIKQCNNPGISNREIKTKKEAFNEAIESSVSNLEKIRENILFESDYNIVVETIHVPTPLGDRNPDDLPPDCYVKTDTILITEPVRPSTANMAVQMELEPEHRVVGKNIEVNVYCPKQETRRQYKDNWKAISFDDLIEGYKYSLGIKQSNLEFLERNCDIAQIVEERNVALKALETMRDKALELRLEIE